MLGALCSRSAHRNPSEGNVDLKGPLPNPLRTGQQKWTISVGYRYQPSSRHFVGTTEQKQREVLGNQIQNTYHMFDVSVSRMISRRWSANASLPIIFAYRNQLYAPTGKFQNNGIGDMTLGFRTWLFRPPTESGGNIGVGLSLKLPTGRYNLMGDAVRNGVRIRATADQSIQLGDGGTGFALDLQAHKPFVGQTMLYFSGSYLFNPRDTNGVSTFRSRPLEAFMSVSDQYLYRGGISRAMPKLPVLPKIPVTVTFGARMEGVPVRDLIGRSNGFRRPGYAISLDPGFMYARGNDVWAVNVPFAVQRNRRPSVTDLATGIHGDAAFADYTFSIGYSRRF